LYRAPAHAPHALWLGYKRNPQDGTRTAKSDTKARATNMSPKAKVGVMIFWFVSLCWLITVKIAPGWSGGMRPDDRAAIESAAVATQPDLWKIRWRDRSIGFAATRAVPVANQHLELRSVVRFEELPVQTLLSDLFGMWGSFMQPLGESDNWNVELLVTTRMLLDPQRSFSQFTTRVDLDDQLDFITIQGKRSSSRSLELAAQLNLPGSTTPQPLLQRRIDLPPGALVQDRLTPRSTLNRLTVGQTWTIPVYRPFPPQSAPEMIQAHVKRLEIIFWQGSDVETHLVEYRREAGTGISVADSLVGREWIRADGKVLRQDVILSGLTLEFERVDVSDGDPRLDWLNEQTHPRLWQESKLITK